MRSNMGLRKNARELEICKYAPHIRRKINCNAGILEVAPC
jgi:hypothetical protein